MPDVDRPHLRAQTSIRDRGPCPLCGRPMLGGDSLNEHHLVPKSRGGTEKFLMHRVCHAKIHSVLTEVELEVLYSSFEKLRSHPALISFIKWVRKHNPEFNTRHRRPLRPRR